MRAAVKLLVALGRLPSEEEADETRLEAVENALGALPPLTLDEAAGLLPLFGDDDCFGLGWTLLHTVEAAGRVLDAEAWTAWLEEHLLDVSSHRWASRLRARARRSTPEASPNAGTADCRLIRRGSTHPAEGRLEGRGRPILAQDPIPMLEPVRAGRPARALDGPQKRDGVGGLPGRSHRQSG